MDTAKGSIAAEPLDRRRLLKLAAASLVVVTGSAGGRWPSDLDAAISRVNRLLAEEPERLAREYTRAVAASVEAYLARSAQWDSSANDLIELQEPWDNARIEAALRIVRIRQSMRGLLTQQQWQRVFG